MSQTNHLPAIFQSPNFGNLVTLPTILQENEASLQKATLAVQEIKLPSDLTKETPEQLEALDVSLNNMLVKLQATEKAMMEKRKPYTGYFDEIKSEFTAREKGAAALAAPLKSTRDAIARERIRRAEEEERKNNLALAIKQEEVSVKNYALQSFSSNFTRRVSESITKMNGTYNSKTSQELDEYGAKLRSWQPVWTKETHTEVCKNGDYSAKHLEAEFVAKLMSDVVNELYPQFSEKYIAAMVQERDRLIELIPSRKKELAEKSQAEIDARLAAEQKARDEEAAKLLAQQQQQLAAQKDQELLEATFEVAATATEAVEQTKNTTRKLKYIPSQMKHWVAIVQLWVSGEMPTLKQEELEKALGKMLTYANKCLAAGTELDIPKTEDVSTRVSKTK